MAKLTEPCVEASAIEHLKQFYSSKHKTETIYAKSQAYTIPKYNGIADGFLCFHSQKQTFHSVSIEAKSYKTLMNLKPFVNYDKLILHVLLTAVVIGISVTFFNWRFEWYWLLLLFLGISIASFFIMGLPLDKYEPDRYKTADVVSQISRYPANEKWIAISSDSVNLLRNRKPYIIRGCSYENLFKICQRKGIGLVLVNHLSPNIVLYPKFRKGKFLNCYNFSREVEAHISQS
ncbi:hypothetical protein [Autumnicola psychrophila]|uniref:YcxB-like protein domain-containing protein n=1 Tax=Autumnicola psychrophila TaxID=3075592 RepID=A0ABU3DPE2_9FLAO|nr:hypothetical protein [Zunongwangia sp. F225]MDT0685579.1 hypothetical protein [Zunongwangia sp. F225]